MRHKAAQVLKPVRVLKTLNSVKNAWERFDAEVKLHHHKIRNYEPNIQFSFERGDYIVKTADDGAELEECLKLRFSVFHKEYMKKRRNVGVDIDKLDYVCDHLVIHDKRTGQVIGTYRLNCSRFTDTFYSTTEFNLDQILALPGIKLELGRACIAREHRNGTVIALLWRGIIEYIQKTETKILFGCASIKTMEPLEIGLISKYLADEGYMTFDFDVPPTRKYKVKQLSKILEYIDVNPFEYHKPDIELLIPTLFKSYMRAGAKICKEPALDREFRCIDFLTVLNVDTMSALFKNKYLKSEKAAII
jgi:putative hemolysin